MTTKRPTPMISLSRHSTLGRLVRSLAHPLALLMAAGSVPAWAGAGAVAPRRGESAAEAAQTLPESALPQQPGPEPAPPPPLIANRTRPQVAPPPAYATFSEAPSVEDVFRARVFGEPLIPVGGDPTSQENADLARAIEAFQARGDGERTEPFEDFLRDHPGSAWRASLLANLGVVYRLTNRFTKARKALEDAWELGRAQEGPKESAVADKALADLLDLHMVFGRQEALERLLAEAEGRDIRGSAVESVELARWTVQGLKHAHEKAVASGPVALDQILKHLGRKEAYEEEPPALVHNRKLAAFHATPEGANLVQMQDLAGEVGLKMRMAYREDPTAAVPLPAMMHLRGEHFAAVVGAGADGSLVLQDPLLGGEVRMSAQAVREEASGHFLIPAGKLDPGWRPVNRDSAKGVRGKCHYTLLEGGGTACGAPTAGGGGGGNGGGCSSGYCRMAEYAIQLQMAGITIFDTPVGHTPPKGPAVEFKVVHNHREANQPAVFYYSNLGSKWSHDWMSYVEDHPTFPGSFVRVYLRAGGSEAMTGFDGTSFAPHFSSHAVLRRVSASPLRYERTHPDGSMEVFALPDGVVTYPRRTFLTEVRDAQGNVVQLSYDAQLRLVALTDAIGQVTTLTYEMPSDPLKITKVTDPFGRSARFEYNDGGQLIRIVDVIGIVSSFEYGNGGYVRALTTPYGTTTFRWGAETTLVGYEPMRWVEATDPLGGTERVEYRMSSTQVPASDPPSQVPTGFTGNTSLNQRNSYYWDKRAHMLHPGDQTKAQITHWLLADIYAIVPVAGWSKMPLENRVWMGQSSPPIPGGLGPTGQPTQIGRVLDDGTSQIHRYEYNSKGHPTRTTDPLGRETVYEYDLNEIDLLRVKQKNGGTYDLLETRTYNAQHLPLTVTDTAGQVTTYTYNSQGQLSTVVTPPRGGLTLAQRTTTNSYDTNGYLQSVTGPLPGATTSFTYDVQGRQLTATDSDSYTVTYDYDALDRRTKATYPDGTFEETLYNRLDPEKGRDRLGRWSETFFDALRRAVAMRDPLGRTITQQWCTCGSLDKLSDANGNVTTWERDLQGRVTREIRADGAAWEDTYENTKSRLKQQKDPKNQITSYQYFLDDNLQQTSYSGAIVATPTVSFTYDAVYNRRATMVDGVGTTTYSYNPVTPSPALGAGRIGSVDGPLASDTVSYTYDELGRVATRGLPGFLSSLSYDALGRVATQGSPLGNFTYGYDGSTGRPLSLSYPNGQTSQYLYFPNSGDHRLQQIKHLAPGGATISKYDYTSNVVGNIATWTQQVGAGTPKVYTLGYDAADQLTTSKVTGPLPLPVPSRLAYNYDGAANRSGEQLDDAAMGASYNSRNQLTSRQAGGPLLFRGTLSEASTATVQGKPAQVAADNTFVGQAQVPSGTSNVVVAATDPSGNARTNTYQVTATGSTTTYAYDANGNLTGDGTKTFEWDAKNQLTAVKQGAATLASFVYDGQGRRVQKTGGGVTRSYVYDDTQVIEERPSAGSTLSYVHGPSIDNHWAVRDGAGVASYFLPDHLGSIVQTTNPAGTVTLSREYDPYGNLLSGASQSGYAFTGREWDAEVGLYYYRARYYDPNIGRFISEDPIGFAGVHVYPYVANNPIARVDPLGLEWQPTGGFVINLDPVAYTGYGEPWPGQPQQRLPIPPRVWPPTAPLPPYWPLPLWWDIDFICTKDGWRKVVRPVVIVAGKAIGSVPPPPDWKPPFQCKPQCK